MNPLVRRLATVAVAVVVGTLTNAPAASAAPTSGAARAAAYVASQISGDHLSASPATFPSDQSLTADGVIALAAAGGYPEEVIALTNWLQHWVAAQDFIDAATASHIVIASVAAGLDPADFGGRNLPALITADAAGKVGYGDPYTQSLAIIALLRSGRDVPTAILDALLAQQGTDGGFGYEGVSDSDNTGLALQALWATSTKSAAAAGAATKAVAWAKSHRTPAGGGYYWAGYSPVNSTAVVAPALRAAGVDVSGAVTWLATQQLSDGGLPATLGGKSPDLLATLQGTLVFAGQNYLSLGGATVTVLPNTGASDGDDPALLGAALLLSGAALAAAVRRRAMR